MRWFQVIHWGSKKIPNAPKQTKARLAFKLFIVLVAATAASLGTAYAHQGSSSKLEASVHKKVAVSAPAVPQGPAQSSVLFSKYPAWAQDFAAETSSKLNSRYWDVYNGPAPSNGEAEYYSDSPANLYIGNGALTLKAIEQAEPGGYNYSSARIDTLGKKTFLYGRIDIVAKLPDSVGTWPAVWLLPATTKYEGLSPASDISRYLNGGEIDLIEQVGISPNLEYGIVHTESDLSNPGGVGDYDTVTVSNNAYNLYSLLWTPTSITFEVNNVPFFTYTMPAGANYTTWPFNQPFYLVLNLALGGSWGGEDTAQYPPNGIDNTALPASMDIQSIYYYPYVGS